MNREKSSNNIENIDVTDTVHSNIICAKGILQYHLCNLRTELRRLFFRHYYPPWRWGTRLWFTSLLRKVSQYFSPRLTTSLTSTRHTMLTTYAQNDINNSNFLPSNSEAKNEYVSICEDMNILLSPDFLHCGCRKLATVQRMRVSYQSFVPPVQ